MQGKDRTSTLFQERMTSFFSLSEERNKKYNSLSILRTLVFVVAAIAFIYFANQRNYTLVALIGLVFPFVFGILLKVHQSIAFQKAHYLFLAKINQAEISRLNIELHSFDNGVRFLNEKHPYALDLDIFGKNSLFQLLNRCTTESAKALLADWLNNPASKEKVLQRQHAVKELVPMNDWRQDFQANGMHYEDKASTVASFLKWLADPVYFINAKGYKFAAVVMPVITIVTIVLYFNGTVHYLAPLTAIVINVFLMRKAIPLATETQEQTYQSIKSLKAYQAMIKKIEEQEFQSPLLAGLKQKFSHQGFSAQAEIKKIKRILDWLNARSNAFYFLFNLIFLIDIHLLIQAERWKRRTQIDISKWFDAINEMEVLVSMAGFSFANPDYTFPEVMDKPHFYHGERIGHPLLKRATRVNNDFSFDGKGNIIVLTGSNMSGKSTFLRTLGTNAVLALMGNVTCTHELKIGQFQLFTSMRTVDSLEESVSSFYAELRRLKQLLETITEEKPVFFMLDEILKGTNSHDRHRGAASLIKQLSKKNAFGIVSTHDIELGKLADKNENIHNFSFTSTIENNEILFDYLLHPGICQSFNASQLMKNMGIEIENNE